MNLRECLLPQVEIERKKKEVKNKKKQFFLFWSYFFFSLGRDNPFFAIRERKSLNGERKEEEYGGGGELPLSVSLPSWRRSRVFKKKELERRRKEEVLVEFFFSFASNKPLLLAPV